MLEQLAGGDHVRHHEHTERRSPRFAHKVNVPFGNIGLSAMAGDAHDVDTDLDGSPQVFVDGGKAGDHVHAEPGFFARRPRRGQNGRVRVF